MLALLGPFALMSTVRFETKHRMLKLTANACFSRVNLGKTIAIKQQLNFCFRVLSNCSLRKPTEVGSTTVVDLRESHMWPAFSRTLPQSIFDDPIQTTASWVNYTGTKYQPKQALVSDVDDLGLFVFAEIMVIVIFDGKPLFICAPLKTLSFMLKVRGYEVERQQGNVLNWFVKEQEKFFDPHPLNVMRMSSGEHVIVLKYLV